MFETLSVDYEYLTQRYDDLTEYPAPDKSIISDTATISTGCGFGMVIPNSNTIMFLGQNRGSRFGLGYKARNLQFAGSNAGGGFFPIDNRDCDNFYWLMNINDIVSASSLDQVPIYQYGVFDNNRWYQDHIEYYKDSQGQQAIISGSTLAGASYDTANKKLYVLHRDIQKTPSTTISTKLIVSVYRIND
mgnify:CR=1 FL=1